MLNRRAIIRAANYLTKAMSRSQAFRTAWDMARGKATEKVAGVTKQNRQTAIEHLTRYEAGLISIDLKRERDNLYDSNAIAIIANVQGKGAYKMGYIPTKTAAGLAYIMDKGISITTTLKSIVGGYMGRSYGLRLAVQLEGVSA